MRRSLWLILIALISVAPQTAVAHDDPIVTVRVLCNGFNVLDMDAVLGEVSDSATLTMDRSVSGSALIRAWVKEQMDADLRIEIVDIGTPQRLPDGYTLKWTGRFSRQDWRRAGMPSRQVSNTVVIHNGRITEWTALLDAAAEPPSALAAPSLVTASPPGDTGFPELFGIPVTLLVAAAVAVGGGLLLLRSALRR